MAEGYAAAIANLIREKRAEGWTDALIEAEIDRIPALAREEFAALYPDAEVVEQIVGEFMAALRKQLKQPSETLY
jgi:hypothetical protein